MISNAKIKNSGLLPVASICMGKKRWNRWRSIQPWSQSHFNGNEQIPAKVVFKPVLKSPEEVYNLCIDANSSKNCIGVIAWMHTFSPAKMWINGLKILHKPLLHLHTQFNRDIPRIPLTWILWTWIKVLMVTGSLDSLWAACNKP